MVAEHPEWFKFEQPSTFTFLGRNDRAVNWLMNYRHEQKLPPVRNVCIIGSGAIEPFTIAALDGLSDAQIFAIEINPDLVGLGEEIKNGNSVPWSKIAELSHNPGRVNSDLTDLSRVENGLARLQSLGSLSRLGSGFNREAMQVDPTVAKRVTFINQDGLFAISVQREIDLIIDCFARVNMNKIQGLGIPYTNELTIKALQALAKNGMYLIGDTGESLPSTMRSFVRSTEGNVNWGSLAHAVQRGLGAFSTSHYTVASLMERLNIKKLEDQAFTHIAGNEAYKEPKVLSVSLEEAADKLDNDEVGLAYLGNSRANGLSINIKTDALANLAPNKGDEFSPPNNGIIFPAQK